MLMEGRYTPTEKTILELLNDGLPHRLDDIKEVLEDKLMEVHTVRQHISNLRKKLVGYDVTSTYHDCRYCYRLVKLLA